MRNIEYPTILGELEGLKNKAESTKLLTTNEIKLYKNLMKNLSMTGGEIPDHLPTAKALEAMCTEIINDD